MSLARVVVTAVIVEGRSKAQVARDYGVARSWVYELLKRFEVEGEVTFVARSRRPHSSYTRFEAIQPNETWQTDFTHWKLRNGRGIEILNFIDDHSRFLIASNVTYVTTGLFGVDTFPDACNEYAPTS